MHKQSTISLARRNPTWVPALGDLGMLAPFFSPRSGASEAAAAPKPSRPLPPMSALTVPQRYALDDLLHNLDLISAHPTEFEVRRALEMA